MVLLHWVVPVSYSAFKMHSDPYTFFTLLLCSLVLKWLRLISSLINIHSIAHNNNAKTESEFFANLSKKGKNEISHWHNYWDPLAEITASSLLGYDMTSSVHLDLGAFCHSSLQILSSLKVGQEPSLDSHFQVYPEMCYWGSNQDTGWANQRHSHNCS